MSNKKEETKLNKYKFELNIDTTKTYAKYIDDNSTNNLPENETTKVSDLNPAKRGTPKIVSFLDESKRSHTCKLSMIDFNSKLDINLTTYSCYWCRHSFDFKPIGCPLKFVPSQAIKTYYSHISKTEYTIKEPTSCTEPNKNVSMNKANYYETDGVFCSFNCCKAYINDNKHKRMYDQSTMLLLKIYNEIIGSKCSIISPAPHWRVLEEYGGSLSIDKFRHGFNKMEYTYHGIVKPQNVTFMPIGHIFEEIIQF